MYKALVLLLAFSAVCISISAQNAVASNTNTVPVLKTENVPAPVPALGKEVVITFRNTAEKPVAIFAGPKEGIREPKINTYGGLSNFNKLYLRENEVVCLMNVQKLPVACTVIKPGVTAVEVNTSANGIVAK